MSAGRSAGVRSVDGPDIPLADLVAAKGALSVSVVLPALNEESTVGGVVRSIRPLLGNLVDELVVMDSGSTDATVLRAREAGARVVLGDEVLPDIPVRSGKGEVLWRSLAATTGDLLAFVDTDLVDPDPAFVPRILRPLLLDPRTHLVKGYYRRPLMSDGGDPMGGGRVTELCARPLLSALVPELASVRQPLAGEYAATRTLLEALPFAGQYGVEIGILVDTWRRYGAEAIAQIDLGVRTHRHRSIADLAVTSRQVIATLLDRCGIPDSGMVPGGPGEHDRVGLPQDRPPMRELRAATSGRDRGQARQI